jgi:hypothetical protein
MVYSVANALQASNDVDRHPALSTVLLQASPSVYKCKVGAPSGWQSSSGAQRQIGIDGFHKIGIID